jgi:hypothetical protein
MDASEADRAQDQGQHRWFTVPFQFEPTGRVLAIMQRLYRFVTWQASFRCFVASRTRLILTGCGSLMSSLESLCPPEHLRKRRTGYGQGSTSAANVERWPEQLQA